MGWQSFLIGIVPLIVFVVIDIYAGPKTAVVSAVILAVVLFLGTYLYIGFFDELSLVELFLIVGLGALSYRLDNTKYFKFQPMILGICLGTFVLVLQIFFEPILIRYIPVMKALTPEIAEKLNDPRMLHVLDRASLLFIPAFYLHALWVGYAAWKWNRWSWIAVRLAIYPVMILAMVFAALI